MARIFRSLDIRIEALRPTALSLGAVLVVSVAAYWEVAIPEIIVTRVGAFHPEACWDVAPVAAHNYPAVASRRLATVLKFLGNLAHSIFAIPTATGWAEQTIQKGDSYEIAKSISSDHAYDRVLRTDRNASCNIPK